MPRGSRLYEFTVGGFLAFGVLLVALGLYLLADGAGPSPQSHTQHTRNPQQQQANKPQNLPIVSSLSSNQAGSSERPKGDHQKQTNDPRPYFIFGDTWAQWVAAIAAIGAFATSLVAVILVNRTLKATGRQLLVENRPWIKIKNPSVKEVYESVGVVSAVLNCSLSNIGKSPAINVRIFLKLHRSNPNRSIQGEVAEFLSECKSRYTREAEKFGSTLFPDEELPITPKTINNIPAEDSTGRYYRLMCCVCYKTKIIESDVLITANAFYLERSITFVGRVSGEYVGGSGDEGMMTVMNSNFTHAE